MSLLHFRIYRKKKKEKETILPSGGRFIYWGSTSSKSINICKDLILFYNFQFTTAKLKVNTLLSAFIVGLLNQNNSAGEI